MRGEAYEATPNSLFDLDVASVISINLHNSSTAGFAGAQQRLPGGVFSIRNMKPDRQIISYLRGPIIPACRGSPA
jgi:hypothetical protein